MKRRLPGKTANRWVCIAFVLMFALLALTPLVPEAEIASCLMVNALGIDVNDILTREEVLVGYSVAVRVPQEVVYNSLIVPTKCIFYDSESKPYVTVRESGRDKRVYVRILLSTGTEAAVEANSGYELNEGDKVVYRADDSLISSILG